MGTTGSVLTVGSVPPALGGQTMGGVATAHQALLDAWRRPPGGRHAGTIGLNLARDQTPVEPWLAAPARSGSEQAQVAALAEAGGATAVVFFHLANRWGMGVDGRELGLRTAASIQSWHALTFSEPAAAAELMPRLQRALDRIDELIFPSRHTLEEGIELGLRYSCPAHVVPNPMVEHWSTASPSDPRDRRGLVFVGSLIARKRAHLAIEAAALLDMPLVVVGEGPLEDELRELARRSGADVRFTGVQDSAATVRAVAQAEALVVPSTSESFGNVYVEAAAVGVPAIGFAPTVREIGSLAGAPIGEPVEAQDGPGAVATAITTALGRPPGHRASPETVRDLFSGTRFAARYATIALRGGPGSSADPTAGLGR